MEMNKKTILPHLGRNCPMLPISLALRSPTSRAHARTHRLAGPACQSASAPTKLAISGAGTWVPHGSSTIFIESHQITENRTRTDSVFFAGSAWSLTTLPPVILVAVTTAASACCATTQAQDRINTGVASNVHRAARANSWEVILVWRRRVLGGLSRRDRQVVWELRGSLIRRGRPWPYGDFTPESHNLMDPQPGVESFPAEIIHGEYDLKQFTVPVAACIISWTDVFGIRAAD
jgi:hypothetical protein